MEIDSDTDICVLLNYLKGKVPTVGAVLVAAIGCLSAPPAQPTFFKPDTIQLNCKATYNFGYTPEMKPADLNLDGFTDLAISCPTEIQVLLSSGKGCFTPMTYLVLENQTP